MAEKRKEKRGPYGGKREYIAEDDHTLPRLQENDRILLNLRKKILQRQNLLEAGTSASTVVSFET